jgi:hypothetical protein
MKKDLNKIFAYASNAFLIAGIVVGAYTLIDIFVRRSRLPAGVCPVSDSRSLVYTAIAFCCLSLLLSFFEGRKKKEAANDGDKCL